MQLTCSCMEVLFFALPLDHAHKDLHKDSTVLRGTGSSLRSSPTPDGAVLRGTGILAQELSFSRRCRHVRNRLFAQKLSLSTTPSTMRYSSSLARRSSAFPSVAWTVAFFILSASPAGIRTLMTTSCPYSISGVGRFSFA